MDFVLEAVEEGGGTWVEVASRRAVARGAASLTVLEPKDASGAHPALMWVQVRTHCAAACLAHLLNLASKCSLAQMGVRTSVPEFRHANHQSSSGGTRLSAGGARVAASLAPGGWIRSVHAATRARQSAVAARRGWAVAARYAR